MHLPEIDRYAHLESPIHRWDPRVRLVSLAGLLLATVLAPDFPTALMALAAAATLVELSRIPVSFIFIHLRWVLVFCLFLVVVLSVTAGGTAVGRLGPVGVSRAGLRQSALIALRAVAAVLLVFPAIGTSPFHVTLKALRRLRVPSVAVQLLAFSYRYVFVLFDEMQRMLSAARARGHGQAAAKLKLRNLGSMMGMLVVRSLNRTRQVRHAMLARGYTGEVRSLDDFRLLPADLAKAAGVWTVAAATFALGVLP